MRFLVMVLCLFCERFLVHSGSYHRFDWFTYYSRRVNKRLSTLSVLSSPWLMLAVAVLPLFFIVALVFFFFSHVLFGLVGFLLHVMMLYVCIGPDNPFYPVCVEENKNDLGTYFVQMNGVLFAVLFWYLLLGPMAVLLYRLVSVCQREARVAEEAQQLLSLFDWIPARVTALLYLLVGNFQAGKSAFLKGLWAAPEHNSVLLSTCGLTALSHEGKSSLSMTDAENLVEHAVMAWLVLMALFTLVAWI